MFMCLFAFSAKARNLTLKMDRLSLDKYQDFDGLANNSFNRKQNGKGSTNGNRKSVNGFSNTIIDVENQTDSSVQRVDDEVLTRTTSGKVDEDHKTNGNVSKNLNDLGKHH